MASSVLHTLLCVLLAILSIVERAAPCIEESTHQHDSTQTAGADAAAQDHHEAGAAGDTHHPDADCQHCFCSCPCHVPALQPALQELPHRYSVAARFLPHAEPPSDGVAEAPDHIPLT